MCPGGLIDITILYVSTVRVLGIIAMNHVMMCVRNKVARCYRSFIDPNQITHNSIMWLSVYARFLN